MFERVNKATISESEREMKQNDQCRHCTYKGDITACKAAECSQHESWYAIELQAENEALRKQLGSLGNHNLKQGMLLAQFDVEPEDITAINLNKFKADAIREAAIMPRWGGQPDDIPADFDGYCQAIHEMHEYANNLTKP